MRACQRLGIRSVAVYTELDRDALHVREADDAIPVTSPTLDLAAIVAAARSPAPRRSTPATGSCPSGPRSPPRSPRPVLVFVGPSAEVMERMGRKDAARDIAVAAGVPVVPSYTLDPEVRDRDYPVLVKAAAGGGGKGMRIVRSADELEAAVASRGA